MSEDAWGSALRGFERHLHLERNRSPHTCRAYLGDIGHLAAYARTAGVDSPTAVDLRILRLWLGEQAERGAARTTLARRAATARTFFAWAARSGVVTADPAQRLAAPRRLRPLRPGLRQPLVHRLRRLLQHA